LRMGKIKKGASNGPINSYTFKISLEKKLVSLGYINSYVL